MSKHSVNQVIQRAISDAAFRRQLQRDPANALAGFDLTKDERSAITSGDPTRLTALGVDQRMSKAFGLGGLSDVSKTVVGDDIVTGGGAGFLDEGNTPGTASLLSPNTAEGGTGVFTDADGNTIDAGIVSTDPSGNAVIVGDPAGATTSAASTVGASASTFDGNVLDPGAISATDFIDVGDGSASDGVYVDPGLISGGQAGVDPGDLNTDASTLDESGGVHDTGGDIRPTEY